MASISTQSGGRRTVQFVDPRDGRRRSIRLGKVSKRTAAGFKVHVEALIASIITAQPLADQTARWIRELDDAMLDRLAAVGLTESRRSIQLDQFLKTFMSSRSSLKPASLKKLEQTASKLREFFTPHASIRSITPHHAAEWETWLSALGLSEATTRLHAGNAKTIFNEAVRRELIAESPFRHLRSGSTPSQNNRYVTPEEASAIVAVCEDPQFRLLFGLARYAGLRAPSETHILAGGDIDLAAGRMRVRSPKTERHRGHEQRIVPLDPRLRALLPPDLPAGPLVTLCHGGQVHRRFKRIVKTAGIQPWPQFFQTLRRSCEIEWATAFPQFAVSKWIGHSITVSGRHYVTAVPDELIEAAAQGRSALQNPVQQMRASSRIGPQR